MRIEKIRFNKIKVTFSSDDLLSHGLTPEAVAKNSPAAQEIFWDVLRRAEEETGFSAENGKLMIEAMTAAGDDSLILYITRLDSNDAFTSGFYPAKKRIKPRIRSVDPSSSGGESCLAFSSFEDIISLVNSSIGLSGGRLYYWNDNYYLIISGDSAAACSEFGKSVSSKYVQPLVEEHGKLLSKSAAEDIREHFN